MDISFSSPIILLGALLVVLLVLFVLLRKAKSPANSSEVKMCSKGGGCCGGVNCHKKHPDTPKIIYYDDHELDRFSGREAGSYTPIEEAEFVEIYETLLTSDKTGWLESLQLRGIILPEGLANRVKMDMSVSK